MLTNTVRIERLSDEEDEEVDITDDLSEDGDAKPQIVIKTEICEPEQPQSSEIQKDSEEQNHLTETRDQPSPRSLSPQSPQLSPSSSEKTSVTGIDEKDNEREYLQPENVQAAAQTDLEQMTDEIKGQSSQSKNSAKWDQLEEACGDGTGTIKTCCFYVDLPHHDITKFFACEVTLCSFILPDSADKTEQSPTDEDQEGDEYEEEEEEELKVPEQEVELELDTITEDEKQAIPEFFEGRASKTPERYLKIRNYILDQWYNCIEMWDFVPNCRE